MFAERLAHRLGGTHEWNHKYVDECKITYEGYIQTKHPLDREAKAAYNLTVLATDSPRETSRRLTATAQVVVIVQDINDNQPVFVYPPAPIAGGNLTNQV
ncbi:unnamed protein product [Protopolystoma xenopodis]|uniref:Cadherin domain-containing protein n=1 Tax=Protopolystoma xenopodis TaxID=117903 RepID=A0A448WQN9_9PLAT|nr:unnamed protein product [Protopolystoma xenopodis]